MTADNGPKTRYNLCMAYQGSFQERKGAYHHVREKTGDTHTNTRTHTGNNIVLTGPYGAGKSSSVFFFSE